MVTGESAKDTVKTIAQGMPVDAVYLWLLTPVLFCCTGGYGCNAHPAFPAPSSNFEGGLLPKLGHFVPRERRLASLSASSRTSERSERDPGPITTGRCFLRSWGPSQVSQRKLVVMGPAFAGTTSVIGAKTLRPSLRGFCRLAE